MKKIMLFVVAVMFLMSTFTVSVFGHCSPKHDKVPVIGTDHKVNKTKIKK